MTLNAHPNHRFQVDIDGIGNLGFSEVVLPETEIEVVEYREGNGVSPRKIPGLVRYTNLVLRRGITESNDLFNWSKATTDGQTDRRNIAVILLDSQLNPVKAWTIHNAWPTRYTVSPLIAHSGETVVTETLECALERFALAT